MATKSKAKESPQILKARQKIEKKLADEEKHISPDSIKSMEQLIKRQLARHKDERIDLKARNVTPTTAKTENKFVLRLLRHLKQLPKVSIENHLEGRIKNIHEKS